jgi:hypothetical protein
MKRSHGSKKVLIVLPILLALVVIRDMVVEINIF